MKDRYITPVDVQTERDRCAALVRDTSRYLTELIARAPETDKPGLYRTQAMLIGLVDDVETGRRQKVVA